MMRESAKQRPAASQIQARAMHSGKPPPQAVLTWLDKIALWLARWRQRRALADLAARDDHLLQDIGLSREDAEREAAKPFWR